MMVKRNTSPQRDLPASLRPVGDTRHTRWLKERIQHSGRENAVWLYSIMPSGFPAYARILHPADSVEDNAPVRWAEVAASTGKTVHPAMQFGRLSGSDDPYGHPDWAYQPKVGQLPEHEARIIAGILGRFTVTPDRCYFCLWKGYGPFNTSYRHLTLNLSGRNFLIFTGPLSAILDLTDEGTPLQAPSLWWPHDRAWCVSTDIDLLDTYVGGNEVCIQQVLSGSDLETLPSTIDARIDFFSDTINA